MSSQYGVHCHTHFWHPCPKSFNKKTEKVDLIQSFSLPSKYFIYKGCSILIHSKKPFVRQTSPVCNRFQILWSNYKKGNRKELHLGYQITERFQMAQKYRCANSRRNKTKCQKCKKSANHQ